MTQRRDQKPNATTTVPDSSAAVGENPLAGIHGEAKPGVFPGLILNANPQLGKLLRTHVSITVERTGQDLADVYEDMRAAFPHEVVAKRHMEGASPENLEKFWSKLHRRWGLFTVAHGMEMYINDAIYRYLHPEWATDVAALQAKINQLTDALDLLEPGSKHFKDVKKTRQIQLEEYCRLLTGQSEVVDGEKVTELALSRAKALSGILHNARPTSDLPLDRDTFISLVMNGNSGIAQHATATPFRCLTADETQALFPEVRTVEHIRTAASRRRAAALSYEGGILRTALPISDRAQMWPRYPQAEAS